MNIAGIFVAPESAESDIERCRAACARRGWSIARDRVVVLDSAHPNQGLPVLLFPSPNELAVLVVPDWRTLARGLLGGVYLVQPDVSGRNARQIATGFETMRAFLADASKGGVRLHVVDQDQTFEPDDLLQKFSEGYEPSMESAAEWDAELSSSIREGQDRAWATGKRVGRPLRGDGKDGASD